MCKRIGSEHEHVDNGLIKREQRDTRSVNP